MMALKGQCVFLVSLLAAYLQLGICFIATCESPQYMIYGETGSVNCLFHEEFFSVLWFDTINYGQSDPIIHYQDISKSGAGYDAGEFDIYPNGSLIVNNVSLQHETTFTALYVHDRMEDVVFLHIPVIVVVKPTEPFPLINFCHNDRRCFAEVGLSPVQCSVGIARPNITLRWVARTVYGDRNITANESITSEGIGYTSRVTTIDTFYHSPLLVLLVCKASSLPGMLQFTESVVLAQTGNIDFSSKDKRLLYIKRYTTMSLACAGGDNGFVVWKKVAEVEIENGTKHEILMYSVFIAEKWEEVFERDIYLGPNASLVVPVTDIEHEGVYYCIYGDGLKNGLKVYDVAIKVHPEPFYPVIEGCDHKQYCSLEAGYEGYVTCKLTGIRPQVQLEWHTFSETGATVISFTNHHLTVEKNEETFDVTLTSTYRIVDRTLERVRIECRVPESDETISLSATKMDLLLAKGTVHSTDETSLQTISNRLSWLIPTIFAVVLLLVFLLYVIINVNQTPKRIRNKIRMKPEQMLEVSRMLETKDHCVQDLTVLKEKFVEQIKEKYKDLYDAVQPIPYIKDKLYCVDKVFVEGGIEFLYSTATGGKPDQWKSLETYQDILNDPQVQSTRRIIEGEPGYGKSTVTLQFAYDWCNASHTSALKDIDILILLRLRQLGGVSSIYRAIKRFLLPKDVELDERDIENILRNCKSAVVILDGFDEYPDQDTISPTDVIDIIANQMFKNFQVVTTTRASFLPKKYPPLTKRIRLTGFDDNSRRFYIRKAVVEEDDEERVQEIERHLQENPILSDLCQVPLLFVIFAHMTYDSEKFRNLNSVTNFFRYMISCFHNHMINKMKDDNVKQYSVETDHHDLDRVAFEALSGNTQKIVWDKEKLCKQIGQEIYDQYLRIGILVEEEMIEIIDDPGALQSEYVEYKTEVRFYHKLFCEWYAAHYISDYLRQNPNVDLNEFLQHLDPFDLQYVYRFSCGLNTDSAEKIISYLKNIEGGDKFSILCILEQTGKVDHIKETIRGLCSEGVVISGHDSLLLQRSSMQLLEIAVRNDIPIEAVNLHNCLRAVNLSAAAITTTMGLVLTSKIPVKKLVVSLSNREMTEDEAIAILKFSSMCPSLHHLKYYDCVPPRIFKDEFTMSTLKSKGVTVKWNWGYDDEDYILNFHTGRWENEKDGSEPTAEDFEKMLSKDAKDREGWTEETYKGWVKEDRENLRKEAQKKPK